jgi:uncharacterized small protein (DUF1192 family)
MHHGARAVGLPVGEVGDAERVALLEAECARLRAEDI